MVTSGRTRKFLSLLALTAGMVTFNSFAYALSDGNLFPVVPIGAAIALIFAFILAIGILKRSEGTEKMVEIAKAVRQGADAFLKRQYISITIFMAVVFVLLFFVYGTGSTLDLLTPVAFLTGGISSGLAGIIGMRIATRSNARTAFAAQESLNTGLQVAFSSGTVMGMTVVGIGLLFTSIWFIIMREVEPNNLAKVTTNLFAFGMGASSVALFARLGGGIYTKAADVGADLVGKVEAGIPEDDPRNPATIADNVGDNVGDVAGMGADLYESYVGSIVATMSLGASAWATASPNDQYAAVVAPMILAVFGIFSSMFGRFIVRTKDGASQENLLWALRKGVYGASILFMIISYILMVPVFQLPLGIYIALIVGLIAGNIIGYFTEYYTSDTYTPTKHVAKNAETGPATVIIAGLAVGMRSTVIPVITIVVATLVAYLSAKSGGNTTQGLYGIGMAAVGMLSTLGITLATDAYGPVADNAGGVAEMAGLPHEVRERTDALDSLGNTTAATGKGFAIGSAALTALTLLAAYYDVLITSEYKDFILKNLHFRISDPVVISGLFIGAVVPFLFSAMTMEAVGKAAMSMVNEVRRQFREIPGIMEGTGKPDYQSCVDISTKGALREMIAPSLLAIISPLVVGVVLGPEGVMAMLAGTMVSGFVLAVMMANAGGSWDNAKKYIERGSHGGKGSDAHKAAVVGDTVGDPFKDTSGPSINILIKLMSIVSIVFAIALLQIYTKFFKDLF